MFSAPPVALRTDLALSLIDQLLEIVRRDIVESRTSLGDSLMEYPPSVGRFTGLRQPELISLGHGFIVLQTRR